jgi:hypothetical protein
MVRRLGKTFVLLAVVGVLGAAGCTTDAPSLPARQPRVKVIDTPAMHLDRIYPSMTGPDARVFVDTSDVGWITAFRTDVIDAAEDEPMGDEFLCHGQLQIPSGVRVMVSATGYLETRFPVGFGMPLTQILSGFPPANRGVGMYGMLLNNHEADIDRYGKVRTTLEYFTDEDVGSPPFLKKLYVVGTSVNVEDLEAYTPQEGYEINEDVTTHCVLVRGRTNHWIVPPGPQVTRTRRTSLLPVDARVHYAAAHMHNHGRYLRLTDVTTGERLWQTDVIYESDRIQIEEIPFYSDTEGFPVFADHEYEIEALYDNTTDHDVDAMAVLYLYYHPNGDETIIYPTQLQG